MTPHCGHCGSGDVRLWGKTRGYDDIYKCECGRVTLWTVEGRLWSPFRRDDGAEVAE